MNSFTFTAAGSVDQAIGESAAHADGKYLAGGTNLIDGMKLGVEQPSRLIDINRVGLDKIEKASDGGLRIGATVRNSDLAYDERVLRDYPALSQALLSGASPQLRNAATTAGNLLQRTRCYYFRDTHAPCNKRQPGSGCSALTGFNRGHAVLGTSDQCIATHPSDMDVAMVLYGAMVHVKGAKGERTISIDDFYVPYGKDPAKENTLEPGELITSVDLPAANWYANSIYLKVRDRASYEFALASAGVAMEITGGIIRQARVALGGVATMPWRARAAEQILASAKPTEDVFKAAAEAELKPAIPRQHNAFKIELSKRIMVRALQTVAAMA